VLPALSIEAALQIGLQTLCHFKKMQKIQEVGFLLLILAGLKGPFQTSW